MPTKTYSGNPAASGKDEVRYLIGDTDVTKGYSLYDEEIAYNLSLYSPAGAPIGQNLLAAAYAAQSILARLKEFFSGKTLGDLSKSANQATLTYFQDNARDLMLRANLQLVPVVNQGTATASSVGSTLGITPTQVGIFVNTNNTSFTSSAMFFDWTIQ